MKLQKILISLFLTIGIVITSFAQSTETDAQSTGTKFTPTQVKSIEQIIRSYLIKNPQVLQEAYQALQQQQTAKMMKDANSAIAQNKQQLFNDTSTPTAGNPNGNVIMVEFFDYQCGHCRDMAPVIEKVVKANKNLKIIFKELPIFGANSQYAAQAAIASMKQGKYYAFHNALFNLTPPITKQKVLDAAQKAGLDVAKLTQDMKNPDINKQIKDNFKLAEKLKIIGTPTFVFSNKAETKYNFIPSAVPDSVLQKSIDALK